MSASGLKKPFACCSDFHLGLRNAPREYQNSENDGLRFLEYLSDHYAETMILGDFYGAIENGDRLDDIRNRYPRLSAFVEKQKYKIWGNHDYIVRNNFRNDPWQPSYIDTLSSKRIIALHGYQFDRYNENPLKSLGIHIARGHSFWENRIRKNLKLLQARYTIPEQFGNYLQFLRVLTFEYNISQFSEHFGFRVIVTGHIHYPTVKRFENGCVYINSGSCIDSFSFSHVDVENEHYEVRQWDAQTGKVKTLRRIHDVRFPVWISFVGGSRLLS